MVSDDSLDVLVVGAGPTGLSLAAQLAAHGVSPRVVDRALDRVLESRALAIQPRTLEVLAGLGVTAQLVQRGNQAVQLRLHTRRREHVVPLFDLGLADTAYPFLLFVSQAQTERILTEHLTSVGVKVERGVEVADLHLDAGTTGAATAHLRHRDGRVETVSARYVVGCDGAHSTVRSAAGIPFEGSSYPQTFVLADTDADGLSPDAAHAFLAERGMLFFFPLAAPAAWRLLAMRPPDVPVSADAPLDLGEVQDLADAYTRATVRLHDPVWMTNFRLHHRTARRYRSGRVFLAGDAAHIHSPAGGQGMNTGIQDAVNLGWKLAHAIHGRVHPAVLDTYEPERVPIGRMVVRFTDQAFRVATSTNAVVRFARGHIAAAALPWVLKAARLRAHGFRIVSQLAIGYRGSPLSVDGPGSPRRGPRAGDRLPDAPLLHNGQTATLHEAMASPGWHLVWCGDDPSLADTCASIGVRYADLVAVHQLTATDSRAALHDPTGLALRRLGVSRRGDALILVRPDGHIGYRGDATALAGLAGYLDRWLPAQALQ